LIQESEAAAQRKEISYAALVDNNAQAKKKLDAINIASIERVTELESLDAAIAEAEARLAAATAEANRAAAIEAAKEQRKVYNRLVERYQRMGEALEVLVDNLKEISSEWDAVQRGPVTAPNHQQFMVTTGLILKTAMMASPMRTEFPHLGPGERMTVDLWFNGKGGFPGLLDVMEQRFAAVLAECDKAKEAA
jgi:hypothetical protein